ncbi:TIGR00730 family Rossman fold protein [Candidatus Falkowbacteria bacterium]|nr:TIGR00730 family Rossman fold protein [Candidatus Falkowbacteria bacterium]
MASQNKNLVKKFRPRISDVLADKQGLGLSWRVFKIISEFVAGFEFLKRYDAAVTFFGSARHDEGHHVYEEARKLAAECATMGFAVITGGGPGVMEAANQGATEAGGESIGLNIQLPREQRMNKYVKHGQPFHYFFTRKVMLTYASEVYVYFPGGYGTLDELLELMTLVQTKKICRVPIILVNKAFWTPLLRWFANDLLKEYKTISPDDLKIYYLVDNAVEATALIKKLIKEGKIGGAECPVEYDESSDIRRV